MSVDGMICCVHLLDVDTGRECGTSTSVAVCGVLLPTHRSNGKRSVSCRGRLSVGRGHYFRLCWPANCLLTFPPRHPGEQQQQQQQQQQQEEEEEEEEEEEDYVGNSGAKCRPADGGSWRAVTHPIAGNKNANIMHPSLLEKQYHCRVSVRV